MAFASRAVSQRGIRDRIGTTLWGRRQPPPAASRISSLLSGVAAVAGGTPVTTASISPAPNAVLVLWVGYAVSGGTTITGVTGLGLTWTQAATVTISSSTKLDCWTAVCGSSPGTGTVQITPGVASSVCFDIDQVIGANQATPLVVSNTKTATGSGVVSSITFNTPAVGDLLMYACAASVFSTQTPGSSWTELADQAQAGPSVSLQTQASPASPPTAGSSTLAVSGAWAAIGIELAIGTGIAPPGTAHTRGQGALKVNPTLLPTGQVHARAQGAPTVNPKLAPSGLVHTRAQGALKVSPQLKPAGLIHTRTQGAPAVGTVLGPAGLTHTRAQGSVTISPKLFPAAQAHTRGQGTITIPGATIRHIGDGITVTVAYVPRPTAQTHARAQGTLTVLGRNLNPTAITHTRAQGTIVLTRGALQPAGLAHARAQGTIVINQLRPNAITHTRTQGTIAITSTLPRPAGLVHARTLGNPVVIGRMINATPALAHARAQGNPTLSARVIPAGLAHARAQGAPEVNLITLHPLALARA